MSTYANYFYFHTFVRLFESYEDGYCDVSLSKINSFLMVYISSVLVPPTTVTTYLCLFACVCVRACVRVWLVLVFADWLPTSRSKFVLFCPHPHLLFLLSSFHKLLIFSTASSHSESWLVTCSSVVVSFIKSTCDITHYSIILLPLPDWDYFQMCRHTCRPICLYCSF